MGPDADSGGKVMSHILAACAALAAVAVRVALNTILGDAGAYLTVLPVVLLCGARLGLSPALLAAGVGVVGTELLYAGDAGLAAAFARVILVFATAGFVGWVGSAIRKLGQRPAPAVWPVTASVPQTMPQAAREKEPEVTLDEAVALAESARRARQRFLDQISHELRTPLVRSLELLQQQGTEDEIRKQITRELELVDNLLDLTRLTNARLPVYLRPASLHEILQDTVRRSGEQLRGRAQKASLKLDAPKDLVNADPVRLSQALAEVLANAARFSDERSVITISTGSTGRRITISIEDGGKGIEPHTLAQIFNAFEQGQSDQFGGLGIGLAIARGLILLHNGSIRVHSDGAGAGTRVEITLPLLERLPEEPTLFA